MCGSVCADSPRILEIADLVLRIMGKIEGKVIELVIISNYQSDDEFLLHLISSGANASFSR